MYDRGLEMSIYGSVYGFGLWGRDSITDSPNKMNAKP